MFKWPSDQGKKTNLRKMPVFDDLKKIMVENARKKNSLAVYSWTDDSQLDANFDLSCEYIPKAFSFEWKLTLNTNNASKLLWTRLSDDAEEISLAVETSVESKDAAIDASEGEIESTLSGSELKKAKRIYEQTFGAPSVKDVQKMSVKQESLTGDLNLLQSTNLIQSIAMGKMSGRLRIKRPQAYADVFFDDGQAVHAEGSRADGNECFIQVICWQDGEFYFEPKLKTDERTITKPTQSLVLEGCLLLDSTEYVKAAGLSFQSVLVKTSPDITESQFEEALQAVDHSLDMELLKAIYLQADNRKTVEDIIQILSLTRSQWIFAIAAILKAELLRPVKLEEIQRAKAPPKDLDYAPIKSIYDSLTIQDTGLYSFPAFLFFLDHEIKYSWERTLSIVLFDLRFKDGETPSPEVAQEFSRLLHRVQGFKGVIAHYEEKNIVTSLIGASASQAQTIADRFLKSIDSNSKDETLKDLKIAVGIACFPHDADSVPTLLMAAELACTRAWQKGDNAISMARTLL